MRRISDAKARIFFYAINDNGISSTCYLIKIDPIMYTSF